MLFEALTTRKTVTVGERLIVPYKLAEVRETRLLLMTPEPLNQPHPPKKSSENKRIGLTFCMLSYILFKPNFDAL